jgi:signal transduction histidine kinase
LTYPQSVVMTAVNDQLKRLALVALTTVLLAGVAAFVLAQGVTRRLEALRSATEALADGDLTSRADETAGAPEIRSLSTSFNQMASRLDTLLTQQRTFAADASHQLRTPLTALRLRLERARDLLTTDPAAAEERLSAADVEAERLGTLVDGLLLLSRTDASNAPRTVVDLAVVAHERVDAWQPLAAELGLTLTLDAVVPSPVLAVATAAEQIVDNYIDNAMSASPPGGSIHVSVVSRRDEIVVEVRDQGPGMSEEDCSRAFDRFWRAESRSAGTGLGLAIVARLAQASGATVDLKPGPRRGLIASARFQASAPTSREA